MIVPEAGDLLAPVMAIEGFRLGCLIDASTGMVLASVGSQDAPPRRPPRRGQRTSFTCSPC